MSEGWDPDSFLSIPAFQGECGDSSHDVVFARCVFDLFLFFFLACHPKDCKHLQTRDLILKLVCKQSSCVWFSACSLPVGLMQGTEDAHRDL